MPPFARSRSILLLAAGLVSMLGVAQQPSLKTVEAELLSPLDTRRLEVGTPVLVETALPFRSGSCIIRARTVLEGRVGNASSHKKGAPRAEIGLLFHPAACAGDERFSLLLTLAAVRAPITEPEERSLEQDALSDAMSASIASHNPMGGGAASSQHSVVRSMGDRLQPISNTKAGEAPLRAGDVAGVQGVKLLLPTATDEPALLFSPHDFSLGRHTRLILVATEAPTPESLQGQNHASVGEHNAEAAAAKAHKPEAATAAPAEIAPVAAPVNIPDETELCVEPRCNSSDDATPAGEQQADILFSLAHLGYLNRSKHQIETLDEDAAIAFLGTDELLMTFNPHKIVPRSGQEAASGVQPRIIRAVLFRLSTGKVERTVDWHVPDRGPYLWELNNGRVLAHVGDNLSIYGRGLTLEHRFPLDGPLAFVSVSPTRELLASGVLHERHTPAMHRKLVDLLGEKQRVEEDLQLKVMSNDLHLLHEMTLVSGTHAPVLLDSGEIFVDPAPSDRWALIERSWDGSRHILTHVHSECEPEVTTMADEMLFVVGCEPHVAKTWYRLITAGGSTVLKGTSSKPDLVQYAGGKASGGLFAIGVVHVSPADSGELSLHDDDLTGITVSVYRSSDGRRVFGTYTASPACSRQSFALSPDGSRLAVVAGNAVRVYTVGSSAESQSAHANARGVVPR